MKLFTSIEGRQMTLSQIEQTQGLNKITEEVI